MRIAYLSTFYPFRGGIAQFNALLYHELERRHTVQAYTFSRQFPHLLFPGATQYVSDSDKADPIPAIPVLDSVNPISFGRAARKIAAFEPELLLMKFWMPFFAPSLGGVAARLRKKGVKSIAILDNLIPHEQRLGDRALLRYFLNRNDGFVVMSKTVAEDLLAMKPDAKFILKSHPIYSHFGAPVPSESAREKLGLPAEKKVLLFFGFIREYKGLDLLIRVMAHLSEDYLLVIAGEMYGDFWKYEKLIAQVGVGAKVMQHVRYIDDNEVPVFFSAADVCVLPYKSATQSGIAQIAFNFDLPVIATDVGGLSEIVDDGETGLILKSNEPEALSEKIRFYFEHNLRPVFSRNIDQNKSRFTWEAFAEAIVDFAKRIEERIPN